MHLWHSNILIYAPVVISSCARPSLAITSKESTVLLSLLLIILWFLVFVLSRVVTVVGASQFSNACVLIFSWCSLLAAIISWRGLSYHGLSLHALTELVMQLLIASALQFGNRSAFLCLFLPRGARCNWGHAHLYALWDAHNLVIAEFGALFTDYRL